MSKHSYKFHYFPARSRGEHLRYILYQSGVQFDDVIVMPDRWATLKAEVPLGFMPYLLVDDKVKLCQSMVVGQFLAAELGLAGRDHLEASQVFMYAHGVNDFHEKLIKHQFHALLTPMFGKEDHNKAAEVWQTELKNAAWKDHCELYTKVLQANGGTWLVGDRVSWADLFQAEIADRVGKLVDPQALDPYPLLKAHCQRVYELPNIKKYVAGRRQAFAKDW